MRRFLSSFFAFAALLACGTSSPGAGGAPGAEAGADGGSVEASPGDAHPGTGDASPGLGCSFGTDASPSGACADFACASCAVAQACSPAPFAATWPDRATCQSRTAARCVEELADPAVKTPASSFAACAVALPAVTCDDFLLGNRPTACAPTPGLVAAAGGCGDPAQCASGYCQIRGDGCGTCQPTSILATAGQACSPDTFCAPGAVCDHLDSNGNGTCATLGAKGQACTQASDCLPTLVCQSSQCVAPLSAGATCAIDANGNDPCAPLQGLACSGAKVCVSAVSLFCDSSICDNLGCCGPGSYCYSPDIGESCTPDAVDGASCAQQNVPSGQAPECTPPAACAPSKACKLYLDSVSCG